MAIDQSPGTDPRHAYARPPFPTQNQDPPGLDHAMQPAADHGETSYVGGGRLKGKVALVTGGDSGIGRAVALAFAREGADVMITHLESERTDADETLRHVREADRKGVALVVDLEKESECLRTIESAVKEFGRIDILVNNAAFQATHESISEIPAEEFEKTFRINLFAMFNLCKAAMPHMGQGGSIINVASVQAYKPSSQLLAYASTKGAIVTFSKALAQEAIEQSVRVNVVAPGPVWTPFIPQSMENETVKNFGKDTYFGRPAQPVELAPLFVLLASDESSYVTGMVMGATGGTPIN